MENIKRFREELKCANSCCRKSYSEVDAIINRTCGHRTCEACLRYVNYVVGYKCPICDCETKVTCLGFVRGFFTTLKDCESLIIKSGETESSLQGKIASLEHELVTPPKDHLECVECGKLYPDQEMQLCETCHELKFKDQEDVKKNALCASCAIKKHIRQGHQTVDFFPYLSAYNFSLHLPMINVKSEEFKNSRDLLSNMFSHFTTLWTSVSQKYDVLTDMARRSKNTKQQVERFEKMETFIIESESITAKANSELKEHAENLEAKIETITKWYETEIDNCVDESELVKLPSPGDADNNKADVDA